jgi:hypothetical protein
VTPGSGYREPLRSLKKRRVFRSRRSGYVVSPARIYCLTRLLTWSAHYTQRCVEHVAFLPNGGEQWTRNLQIRIPRAAPRAALQIVSLGVYGRRRFPDIEVRDASGKRVDLLTRDQHGQAITQFVLARHLRDFTDKMQLLNYQGMTTADQIYRELYDRIYELVTSVGDVEKNEQAVKESEQAVHVMGQVYAALLSHFGAPPDAFTRIVLFAAHVCHLQRTTQYLCWVQAQPGEVVSLMAKHTTVDARRKPLYLGFVSALETFWHGLIEPRKERREVWAKWYCEFGLAPISYDFPAPGKGQIGSYYFTLEAPNDTDITYFDFEHTNSFQDQGDELDCSLHSIHIHNTEEIESEYSSPSRLIRAYLRCSSHGHKQIAAGALLNGIFVALVAHSGFKAVTSSSAQVWLLATPTIVMAYLVEQQRHYHAYATRRQRGVLWIYLFISVAFLVVVSYHLTQKAAVDSSHWHWFSTAVGILLIISSVAVFVLYALLGYSFRFVTTVLTRQRLNRRDTKRNLAKLDKRVKGTKAMLEQIGRSHDEIDERINEIKTDALASWRCYEKAVQRYCGAVLVIVVGAALLAGLSTKWWWHFPVSSHHPHQVAARHLSSEHGKQIPFRHLSAG